VLRLLAEAFDALGSTNAMTQFRHPEVAA